MVVAMVDRMYGYMCTVCIENKDIVVAQSGRDCIPPLGRSVQMQLQASVFAQWQVSGTVCASNCRRDLFVSFLYLDLDLDLGRSGAVSEESSRRLS